jgi:hypothetical protein
MHRFEKYHFRDQHPDERILLVVHRHWFHIALQFLLITLAVALILGSFVFITWYYPTILTALGAPFLYFMQTTFFIFVWFYAFFVWVDYYLDVWIITNERIVNIEQKGFFNRDISELEFSNIQDVTTEVTGFINTMLNFGDVYVQTAAERERFVFEQVPDPYGIKGLIMQLHRESKDHDDNGLGNAKESPAKPQ